MVFLLGRQAISYMHSSTCPESIHIVDSGQHSIAIRLISCVREHNTGFQKGEVPKVNEETVRTSSDPGPRLPFCYWHSVPHGVHVILASIMWEWTCNHYIQSLQQNCYDILSGGLLNLAAQYKEQYSLDGITTKRWPKWLHVLQQQQLI